MLSENNKGMVNEERDNSASVWSKISHTDIRSTFKGPVITPDDDDYERARTIFYGGADRKPAVIMRALDVGDVQYAVSLARETGLEFAIRSGGHSFAGHSLADGGIVLDMREMCNLHIDPKAKTAWAETGLTAGDYTDAAAVHGLATGFGDTGSVGIGGITLGGGVGYLARKYGLTIDDLLAAEVVTADGQLLHVDGENNSDLFWAIRGGGGNFGVATRFKFRLHQVDRIIGGMLVLPATPGVLASFLAEAEAAPDELSTIANVMPAPPMPFLPAEHHGKLVLLAMMVFAGDLETGEQAVIPFRKLSEPIVDLLKPMRYSEMLEPEEEDYHPTAAAQTMFLDRIDYSAAEAVIGTLQESDASMRVAQLRVLGGAMARVPVEATAYAHRRSRIMVNLAAFYNSPEEKILRQKWVEDFAAALNQGSSAAYVNFLGDEGEARIRDAYPGITWDRLRAVKTRYDPTNLFRVNHNIPPLSESERELSFAMLGKVSED
jgi:FAD/FMN-containing dehydrogenase